MVEFDLYRTLGLISGLGIFSFIANVVINIYKERKRYQHVPGPKTEGILGFFAGNFTIMSELKKRGKIFPDKLVEWHQEFGSVYKIQLGFETYIVTSDRKMIREIFITKNYPKTVSFLKESAFPFNQRVGGHGLFNDENQERWRHRRNLFNIGFNRNMLLAFTEKFNTITDVLLEKLTKIADGKTSVSLYNEVNSATLDAIGLVGFGMHLDSINNPNAPFKKYIAEVLRIIFSCVVDPFSKINPFKIKERKNLSKCNGYLRDLAKKVILEKIEQLKNHEINPKNDLFTIFLDATRDDAIDLEIMIDDFITFFIAGQETTANSLGFALIEIGRNPDILKKAQDEISEVLGARTEITYEDISKLKYCSAIFKEALRLYPPGPTLSRITDEEIEIAGYSLPEGTKLALSPYMSQRLEEFFPEPYKFKPERFLKDSEAIDPQVENFTYFPFSLGPRNCIGLNFAKIEGVIVIAKLLQRFEYELDPSQSFIIEHNFTIRPAGGARAFLTLRS